MTAARVVQPQRQHGVAIGLPGVVVKQPVAHLAGHAHYGIFDAHNTAELGGRREVQPQVGARGGVAVVVVRKLARSAELPGRERVIEAVTGAAGQACLPVVRAEVASLVGQETLRNHVFSIPTAGKHLDHARRGFGAEQRALRSPNHLDPVHIATGQMGEVELASRIVDWHSVDQEQGSGTLGAPGENGGETARPARRRHLQAREIAKDVGDHRELALSQIVSSQDAGRHARLLDGGLVPRGGHHNPLADTGYRQRHLRLAGGGHVNAPRFETGRGDGRLAVVHSRDLEAPVEFRDGSLSGAFDSRATNDPAAGVQNHTLNSRLLGTHRPGSEKKLAGKEETLVHETSPLGTHHSSS